MSRCLCWMCARLNSLIRYRIETILKLLLFHRPGNLICSCPCRRFGFKIVLLCNLLHFIELCSMSLAQSSKLVVRLILFYVKTFYWNFVLWRHALESKRFICVFSLESYTIHVCFLSMIDVPTFFVHFLSTLKDSSKVMGPLVWENTSLLIWNEAFFHT